MEDGLGRFVSVGGLGEHSNGIGQPKISHISLENGSTTWLSLSFLSAILVFKKHQSPEKIEFNSQFYKFSIFIYMYYNRGSKRNFCILLIAP